MYHVDDENTNWIIMDINKDLFESMKIVFKDNIYDLYIIAIEENYYTPALNWDMNVKDEIRIIYTKI